MASRSWNRVELMGNLTRDPELRFTPNGAAVCTFGLATNRSYMSEGERKEEVDFHQIVTWNKLAELCNQLLKKGSRVFVSGRLQYKEWDTPEGQKRRNAEIVVEDMIQLTQRSGSSEGVDESAPTGGGVSTPASTPAPKPSPTAQVSTPPAASTANIEPEKAPEAPSKPDENINTDDLPF